MTPNPHSPVARPPTMFEHLRSAGFRIRQEATPRRSLPRCWPSGAAPSCHSSMNTSGHRSSTECGSNVRARRVGSGMLSAVPVLCAWLSRRERRSHQRLGCVGVAAPWAYPGGAASSSRIMVSPSPRREHHVALAQRRALLVSQAAQEDVQPRTQRGQRNADVRPDPGGPSDFETANALVADGVPGHVPESALQQTLADVSSTGSDAPTARPNVSASPGNALTTSRPSRISPSTATSIRGLRTGQLGRRDNCVSRLHAERR